MDTHDALKAFCENLFVLLDGDGSLGLSHVRCSGSSWAFIWSSTCNPPASASKCVFTPGSQPRAVAEEGWRLERKLSDV